MQFYGDRRNYKFLIIYYVLFNGTIFDRVIWIDIIRKFVIVLIYVYDVGFLYNDIKANNIFLDIIDGVFNSVIIDFGKSFLMDGVLG